MHKVLINYIKLYKTLNIYLYKKKIKYLFNYLFICWFLFSKNKEKM